MKKTDKKESQISIRVSPEEKESIAKAAKKAGMTVSNYVIQMCVISQSGFIYTPPLNYVKIITKMQSLTNMFKIQRISRKDYIKKMDKEMVKLWP